MILTLDCPDGLTPSDGGIVVGEPEAGMFWFPVNEHPSDKARIVVRATVPKGLQAVSNGRPEGRAGHRSWVDHLYLAGARPNG